MDRRMTSKRKSLMRKSKKNSVRAPPSLTIKCNFVFDIIVTDFVTPQLNSDDLSNLKISVEFNGQPIQITENRIKVEEFVEGTSTNFIANPFKLRQAVEECGMPVSVNYNGIFLGSGLLFFPESFTENICEDMIELNHFDKCNFKKDGEIVGTVEFMFRLTMQCEDVQEKGPSECRQLMGSCISPKDIMFVIDDSQRPCIDYSDQDVDDEPISLQLLRHQVDKPKPNAVETMLYNPVLNGIITELKEMTKESLSTMDAILRGTKQQPTPLPNPADFQQGACDLNSFQQLPNSTTAKTEDREKSTIKPLCFPGGVTKIPKQPEFAACCNCGSEANPEQIMLEILGKADPSVEDYCKMNNDKPAEKNQNPEHVCRCRCRFGKICAFCRIREQCAEFLNLKPFEPPPVASEEEDYCGLINEQLERDNLDPFLKRLFSELRFMHDIKDTEGGN
ncbi:hypothetical protein KR044_011457 [Drosophila immigrans]|nr:hypothetical protein KR044_011457 [Drosophila immigrans]